ncbi:MAG: fatty acid desaturase [Verrucomicrobiales bacterium]|nr:fatty acid desaturase [Verrucomicrobiales bacterium]
MCLDPETYRLSHASHHLHANTDRDRQMYPEGFLANPTRARLQFALELVLGNLAWEIATTARLRRQGMLPGTRIAAHLPGRLVVPGVLAWFFATVAPEAAGFAIANFIVMFWSGSLMTRHNQWLQHLGIFASGDEKARNLLTRNLRNETLLERTINFLNHDDSVAHTYHHTEPGSYTRLDSDLHPASDHVQVTLRDYWKALTAFYRELFGPSPSFEVMHLDRPRDISNKNARGIETRPRTTGARSMSFLVANES